MKNKFVCVTGGTGFIGSHLVEHLAKENEVVVLDNLSTGSNIDFVESLGAKIVECDIGDNQSVQSAFESFDVVFHLAAMNRAQRSIDNPMESNRINIGGTLNILEACRLNNVPKCVFSSSSSVYGGGEGSLAETQLPNPLHPYAVGKLASEYYSLVYNKVYGMKNSVVRYFSVFGPRQRDDLEYAAVIPKFIGLGMKNEPLTVYGDGDQTRNFTFVKDVVEGTVLVADSEKAVGEVYNIASDEETSINDIVDGLSELFERKLVVKQSPLPYEEPRRNLPDISKARAIGFEPKYSFKEGLHSIFDWYTKKN